MARRLDWEAVKWRKRRPLISAGEDEEFRQQAKRKRHRKNTAKTSNASTPPRALERPSPEQVRVQIGLSRELAEAWGVPYPPKAGWKDRLIACIHRGQEAEGRLFRSRLRPEQQNRFDELRKRVVEAEDLERQANGLVEESQTALNLFLEECARLNARAR